MRFLARFFGRVLDTQPSESTDVARTVIRLMDDALHHRLDLGEVRQVREEIDRIERRPDKERAIMDLWGRG